MKKVALYTVNPLYLKSEKSQAIQLFECCLTKKIYSMKQYTVNSSLSRFRDEGKKAYDVYGT